MTTNRRATAHQTEKPSSLIMGNGKQTREKKKTQRRSWHCKTFRDTNLSNYRVPSYLLHFSFLDLANFCCFDRFVSFRSFHR